MLISVQLSSFLHLMRSLPRLFDWSDCEYVDRALDMFVHGTDVEQKVLDDGCFTLESLRPCTWYWPCRSHFLWGELLHRSISKQDTCALKHPVFETGAIWRMDRF
jgi:hypothetical protein